MAILTAADFKLNNSPSADDVAALNAALAYLQQSPTASAILQQMKDKGVSINIVGDRNDGYNPDNSIDWDPKAGLIVSNTGMVTGVESAAVNLIHEGAHATDTNLTADTNDKSTAVIGFPNAAELYAVNQANQVATELGEAQRTTYTGGIVDVQNATDHTISNGDGTLSWQEQLFNGQVTVTRGSLNVGDIPTDNSAPAVPVFGNAISISNATVVVGSGSQVIVNGANNNVSISNGGNAAVNGSDNSVSAGSNANINVSGGNDRVNLTGTNDYVGLLGGSGYSVYGTTATISTWANTGLSVYGGNDNVNLFGTGSNLMLEGNTGYTVNATGSTISTWDHTGFFLSGGNDVVNFNGVGSNVDLEGGSGYLVNGTNNAIETWNDTGLSVSGGDDSVNIGSGSTLMLEGNVGYAVTGSASTISTWDHTGFTLAGGGDTVNLIGNGSNVDLLGGSGYSVNGSNDTVSTSGNTSLNLAGGNDTVDFGGTNNYVGLLGGSGYAVNGTESTISTWNNTGLSVYGGHDSVNIGTGSNLTLEGNVGYAVTGSSSTISTWDHTGFSLAGGGDTVDLNGDGSVVDLASGTGYAIYGSNDTVYGYQPGADNLYGTGDGYYSTPESGVDFGASGNSGDGSGGTGGGGSTDPGGDIPDDGGDCVDGDPIVINMQGQAVQTVGVANSPASFDWQSNGQAVRTGWGTAGEGYLVYDPNDPDNTTAITQDSQLVGGFGALQSLASQVDGTGSGTLSASDTLWKDLKVWVDFTGTGQFQSGDLYSLDQLGITGINLNATAVNLNSNGNTILDDSSFTMATGATGDMAGVNLQYVSAGATASQVPSSNADQLVQAMASFAPDTAGAALTFDPSQLNPTAPLLAAAH